MACENKNCSCMDRFIRWLEDAELAHAERALKLSKFPNEEKRAGEHLLRANTYKRAYFAAIDIRNCECAPPKRLKVVSRKPAWYQRIFQFLCKEQ